MTFVPDISAQAGGSANALAEFSRILDELGVSVTEDNDGNMWTEFTPGSYEPIRARFYLPEDLGIVALEGELLELRGDANDEVRTALNFLNVEVDAYRFYVGQGGGGWLILVRHDLLPNTSGGPMIHPRELRQALTGLCSQKAIFSDALDQVAGGKSWRYVKDALRAFR